jgi:N-acylglucosamine 2-epimerase
MPFWMRHAVDEDFGGLLTCIGDDGRILSTDKFMWSQTRALWLFSALYRRIERRADWLAVARQLYEFCRRYGMDDDDCWRFRTSRQGEPIDGPLSIVTDCFAIYGLTEFARATGEAEPVALACRTFASVERRLNSGRPFGTAPYPLPTGMKAHRYSMQCSLMYHELATLTGDEAIRERSRCHSHQILHHFLRPEHRAIVEYTNCDGSFSDSPAGRTMVPGHGIEAMWFQLQIARETGDYSDLDRILAGMEWCCQRGWDPEYGGLFLGLDIFGREPPFWQHAAAKLWWPATEALCGTLLAHEADAQEKWLRHHRQIAGWALNHFPVLEHGEWRQRLDRRGVPLREVVALPVKDPFHLPRALLIAIEALDRMTASRALNSAQPSAQHTGSA